MASEDVKKSVTNPEKSSAFERLPDEIIEQILQLTNPNGFASLIILNQKWRMVSQQAHLYTQHLSRCPSYSAAHHAIPLPEDDESLPRLRRLFAREIKRNLFEAYLRPSETVINLVSTSISSSSAPGGEAFHFSLSPGGNYVLAYSSSRIHVIDVTGPDVVVRRELKILRRPASATITDNGSLLAVLSTDLQVDLYDLTGAHPKHTHAVALDHTPRTIALSPTGAVLAAAYDSGVEVSSLDSSSTSTERRAVKCYAVDSLSFSKDGTQLLGSTMQSRNPSTVVLTAPYYNTDSSMPDESVSNLWTTSILFPNGSRDCSHAVLLPNASDGESSWTFTYDRVFETFRAVRIDDLRNGTTYFTGPLADAASVSKLLPSTLPAASKSGDLVASGFQGAVWLYGVPEDLDALPIISHSTNSSTESGVSTPSSQLARRNSAPSLSSLSRLGSNRVPQWQLLCDRFRNTFVEGRKIAFLDQVSTMGWVNDMNSQLHGERLVAVAPGVGAQPPLGEDDGMSPVDGGRISILDFDYAITNGRKKSITIEVGLNEPEVLEEEHRDLDTEVAIVRRRTVAQRRGNRNHVSRSVGTISRPSRPEPPPVPVIEGDLGDPFSQPLTARRVSQQATATDQSETASVDEELEAFDAPYSHTSPRSGTTLRRAATAAAVNRRLHPRAVAQEHIQYRRADGREEHPHESDADNWVPPPPPYSRDPVPPLPEHIQRSLLAEAAASTLQRANTHRAPSIDFPGMETGSLSRSRTVASTSTNGSRREPREPYPFQRSVSDSTTMNMDRVSFEDEPARPLTSPTSAVSENFDDLYDVSPPGTPPLSPAQVISPRRVVSENQIPRRPVGAPLTGNTAVSSPSRPATMQATLEGPVSPIPQPVLALSIPMDDGEVTTQSEQSRPTSAEVATTSNKLIDKEVPPRPTQDHHLTELPPETPIMPNKQQIIESSPSTQTHHPQVLQENYVSEPNRLSRRAETVPTQRSQETEHEAIPIWKRSDTAPLPPTRVAPNPSSSGVVLPSAEQLARLGSRQGRPPSLTDPSRRLSGGNGQQPRPNSGHRQTASWGSAQQTPPRIPTDLTFRNTPPRATAGAYGSPSSRTSNSPSQNPYSGSSQRRISLNSNSRLGSNSPSLRPPIQRLETIHSIASNGEPSPYFAQKAMNVGVGRQPSRAERSAAKNIKDAKKRGWRASVYREKKKKDKYGDTASSAGWTDVSAGSGPKGLEKKTGGKCMVM
ncbi:hypothetical protein G7Y89_g13157 [Cudoniella acicularis]|uniref:F-box domain-containing protein n=1 Tax=Cudoniella acicularis TaxID=354080 RepID=A0A8H4R7T1_9HELO|nr:hypothetical protein G7Y89_g13157 [Cudoniella acicularis]